MALRFANIFKDESWVHICTQALGFLVPGRLCCACDEGPGGRDQSKMGALNFKAQFSPPVNPLWNKKENEALMEPVNVDEVMEGDGAFNVSWVHQSG